MADWTKAHAVPSAMYGIPAWAWFDLASLIVAAGLSVLMVRHVRRPLAVVPETAGGRGQGLYLLILAIMVIGNFERALVGFTDQRLITEGVIHLHAVICTVLLLVGQSPGLPDELNPSPLPSSIRRVVTIGLAATLVCICLDWIIVRAIYGDRFAGHAGLHIRFGPRATTSGKG